MLARLQLLLTVQPPATLNPRALMWQSGRFEERGGVVDLELQLEPPRWHVSGYCLDWLASLCFGTEACSTDVLAA
jgi:hypothetical protein